MEASLTDPLTLMREYATAKKPITLEGDHIVIGRTRFPRTAKTAYKNTGPGMEGNFYPLDSLWSILQGKSRAEYVRFCGSQGIEVVHLKDRKALLDYLEGRSEGDSQSIDYSQYVPVQPVGAERVEQLAEHRAEHARPGQRHVV